MHGGNTQGLGAFMVVLLISVVEQSFVVPQYSSALAMRVVLAVPVVALIGGSTGCFLFRGRALRGLPPMMA